jgi:hypothetical protein
VEVEEDDDDPPHLDLLQRAAHDHSGVIEASSFWQAELSVMIFPPIKPDNRNRSSFQNMCISTISALDSIQHPP